ncbi:hypothetical protein SZ55_2937 [Pseudomonas sp. FeS53a]|nr:hypothetical protein SZ55_2937 [Pseudomonas sp. FeS53a]
MGLLGVAIEGEFHVSSCSALAPLAGRLTVERVALCRFVMGRTWPVTAAVRPACGRTGLAER